MTKATFTRTGLSELTLLGVRVCDGSRMAGIVGAEAKRSHLKKQVESLEITLDMARVFKPSKPSSSAALSLKKKKKPYLLNYTK